MPSVRKRILDELTAALKGINGAFPYLTSVPASHVLTSSEVPDEYPALIMTVGPESSEPSTHDLLTFRLPVFIECWVDGEEGKPGEAIEDLLADVRTAVQNHGSLWALVIELEDLGASGLASSGQDDGVVQCVLNLSIVYRHARTNPSQP